MRILLIIGIVLALYSCEEKEQCYDVKIVSSNNILKACGRSNNGWKITEEIPSGEVCGLSNLRKLEMETNKEWTTEYPCSSSSSQTARVTFRIELVSTPK